MTEETTRPVITRTVVQYRHLGLEPGDEGYMTDADAAMVAQRTLAMRYRGNDEAMSTEPVAGAPVPVVLNADQTGWTVIPDGDTVTRPTGHIIEWTATGRPLRVEGVYHPDSDDEGLLVEGEMVDGGYVIDVPEALTTTGGAVRVRHGLDTEVVVWVYAGDERMGYLFAQDMSPNEVHVEFFAGATMIRVEPEE